MGKIIYTAIGLKVCGELTIRNTFNWQGAEAGGEFIFLVKKIKSLNKWQKRRFMDKMEYLAWDNVRLLFQRSHRDLQHGSMIAYWLAQINVPALNKPMAKLMLFP